MKYIIAFLFSISLNTYSQTKEVNKDSLDWEKQGYVFQDGDNLNKLEVSKQNGTISLYSDIKKDHRIFGYEKPDVKSKRKILFSVFTFDVKDNPCNCEFGSYYETSSMKDITLKYVGDVKSFIKVDLLQNDTKLGTVYFEKKWVEFE
ncbi:hypothetical protein J2X31_002425 [Flavobacterium arsenatis]|uniref:Uncharacterized protein n=1 Tax=Flavobacterium arsenatis TaxID=1484332 RepID=A0ABU1TQZ8_9FLAO|nr:hypothetical protein [Flavobacterium arsenatis]MDR6968402.1 hypothetical protein [Flavobacterium arsenatis]